VTPWKEGRLSERMVVPLFILIINRHTGNTMKFREIINEKFQDTHIFRLGDWVVSNRGSGIITKIDDGKYTVDMTGRLEVFDAYEILPVYLFTNRNDGSDDTEWS
jgi:hypothetical protein